MAIEVTVKRWGNSLGVVLPKDLIDAKGIEENETVKIEVVKKAALTKLFGSQKRVISGQAFKDMVRSGWSK